MKKNGVFVEAGANDGEELSNTLMLEKDMDWTGLLVESDPKAFDSLAKKHRKAWTTNLCLSPSKAPEEVRSPFLKVPYNINCVVCLSVRTSKMTSCDYR